MALKFHCPNCKGEIVSKYLNIGDTIKCLNCGTEVIIPENVQGTNEESTLLKPVPIGHKETPKSKPNSRSKSNNSNNLKIFTSPAGAGIAIICFFLPWVKFSCGGPPKYASGAELGGVFWLVFFAALAIVGAFFILRSQKQTVKSRPVIIISSIVAMAVILFKYIEFANGGKSGIRPGDIGLSIQFGGIGTIIGFVVALIGVSFLNLERDTVLVQYCEDCGSKLQQGDEFCGSCGSKIS